MNKRNANAGKNSSATPNTLRQVLVGLMSKQKDGVITLAQFIRKCPINLREGALEFLRNVSGGDFIEGRRGHPSRFVFGEALEKWNHQEARRREWRIANGLNPDTGGPLRNRGPGRPAGSRKEVVQNRGPGRPPGSKNEPRSKEQFRNSGPQKMALRVNVGGQKTTIPLEMEVVQTR